MSSRTASRQAAFFFARIFIVSFSHIYLGVHWFSDVVAGISFGLLCIVTALLLHRLGDGDWKSPPFFRLPIVTLGQIVSTATRRIPSFPRPLDHATVGSLMLNLLVAQWRFKWNSR